MLGVIEPQFVPGHKQGGEIGGVELFVDEKFFGELGDEIVKAGVEGFFSFV